ncbi:hypothetical protein H7T43_09880 [Peribacillus simplex]|uniref:hypothetical protein n=1 Tax=Peribacillus TaxID=2675229 RepID=UPI00216118B9|nr:MULTISPECIES: hypothetical protein [Peribacillus]MBX9955220.1 hypothetical protein [Peribacillus simplex]
MRYQRLLVSLVDLLVSLEQILVSLAVLLVSLEQILVSQAYSSGLASKPPVLRRCSGFVSN